MIRLTSLLNTNGNDINLFIKNSSHKIYINKNISYNYINLYQFLIKNTDLLDQSSKNDYINHCYNILTYVYNYMYIDEKTCLELYNYISNKFSGISYINILLFNIQKQDNLSYMFPKFSEIIYILYNKLIINQLDMYIYHIFDELLKYNKLSDPFSLIFDYNLTNFNLFIINKNNKVKVINFK